MKKVVGSLLALTLLVSPAVASAANIYDGELLVAKRGNNGNSDNGNSGKGTNSGRNKSVDSKSTSSLEKVEGSVNSKDSKDSRKAIREEIKQEKKRLLEEFKNNKTELKARAKELRQKLETEAENGEEKAELLETTAELLEEAGDLDEAIDTQEEAVQEDLTNVKRYKKLAKLMEKKGNKDIKAFVNGKHPKFDVPPVIKSGRTLVPIRAISETLGAEVTWNQEEQTALIVKDGVEIKLVLNQVKAYVNGEEIELDVPSSSINSRIVVPLRFISEAFNADVQWEDETDSVIIVEDEVIGETTDETTTDEIVVEDTTQEDTTTDETQEDTVTDETVTDETDLTENNSEPTI